MIKSKHLFLTTFLVCVSSFWVYAQNEQYPDENIMGVKKGNLMLSAGYSVPSALRIYLRREQTGTDLTVDGYGPLMAKLEYALFKKFTIGVSGFYSYSDVHWVQDAKNAQGELAPFRHGVIVKEAALGLRLNYYFLNKAKWNMYGGVGVGRGYANAETYTEAPKDKIYINHTFPSPYNFEGTVGARYFLNKYLGFYAELGIGQSWLLYQYYYIPAAFGQLGITFKL